MRLTAPVMRLLWIATVLGAATTLVAAPNALAAGLTLVSPVNGGKAPANGLFVARADITGCEPPEEAFAYFIGATYILPNGTVINEDVVPFNPMDYRRITDTRRFKTKGVYQWRWTFICPPAYDEEQEEQDPLVATSPTFTFRVGPPPPLKANAGKDKTVRRGATVTFNASKSTGDIESYRWTYELGPGCPAKLKASKVVDSGRTVTATLLCSVTATLKVKAGKKSYPDTVHVFVRPRESADWRVRRSYSTQQVEGPIFPPPLYEHGGVDTGTFGCTVVPGYRETGPFCPPAPRNWKGFYTVDKVTTKGPFAGWAYVTDASGFEIHRVGLLNNYMRRRGPPPARFPGAPQGWATAPDAYTNFYNYNSDPNHPMTVTPHKRKPLEGAEAVNWLINVTAPRHEGMGIEGIAQSGHMQALKRAVTTDKALGDPRRYLETVLAKSTAALTVRIKSCLRALDEAIYDYMKDPLFPAIERGTLSVSLWSEVRRRYVKLSPNEKPYKKRTLELPRSCLRPAVR
jgi:hypothetical protein